MKKITNDAAEELIYDAQEKEIESKCGVKAAKNANYGWAVDETDEYPIVSTKIYTRDGNSVLTSTIDKKGNVSLNWV